MTIQVFLIVAAKEQLNTTLPYILAHKSQNLGQNLAPKVGATYPWVIK